jgi:hypothetical protein
MVDSLADRADDAVLRRLVEEAQADTNTVGLILSGSRSAGYTRPDSDYDVYWVLRDDAFAGRAAGGEPDTARRVRAGQPTIELLYTCPRRLHELAVKPGWWSAGYVTARVLLDKTGEIAVAVQAIATMSADRARADAVEWYDAYLNSFYRSLKAWRRDDRFGGRLHAAESALYLIRMLFSLEGRWPPYLDRLEAQWTILSGQGWQDGELRAALLGLVDNGEPKVQIALEVRVEALMEVRGFGQVLDEWHGDIAQVKTWFV